MDVLSRIKSTEFRNSVLRFIQDAKLLRTVVEPDLQMTKVERTLTYSVLRNKLAQDINAKAISTEKRLLHDIVLLYYVHKRVTVGFDKKYQNLIASIESYVPKASKDFIKFEANLGR